MSGVGSSHSDPGRTRSSIGMMTGGSATMRSSPSTSSARLANTRVLSRVLALAAISSIARASLLPTRLTRTSLRTSLSSIPASKCSYHASRLPIPAARRIRLRYSCDPGHDDGAAVGRGEAAVASHDLEAGREPLHVPLPRAGERLVEVVDVEQHLPLGRAEQAEVRQVGVTAQLHGDPAYRGRRQVGRHDQRGAPVEGERRDQHPPVADRDQVGYPARRLLFEQRDRIGAVRSGLPSSVTRPWCLLARGQAPGDSLVDGQVPAPPRRRERSCRFRRRARARARTFRHGASSFTGTPSSASRRG